MSRCGRNPFRSHPADQQPKRSLRGDFAPRQGRPLLGESADHFGHSLGVNGGILIPTLTSRGDAVTEFDIAIIGAGAAGLAAGSEAQRQSLSFVLLEAKDRIGGRAHTESHSLGFPFDHGCHWLHSASINPHREAADRFGVTYRKGSLSDYAVHDGCGFVEGQDRDAFRKAAATFDTRVGAVTDTDAETSLADCLDPTDTGSGVARQFHTLLNS